MSKNPIEHIQVELSVFPKNFYLEDLYGFKKQLLSNHSLVNKEDDIVIYPIPPEAPRDITRMRLITKNQEVIFTLSYEKLSFLVKSKEKTTSNLQDGLGDIKLILSEIEQHQDNELVLKRAGYINYYACDNLTEELLDLIYKPCVKDDLRTANIVLTYDAKPYLAHSTNLVTRIAVSRELNKAEFFLDYNTHQSLDIQLKVVDLEGFITHATESIKAENTFLKSIFNSQ